MIPSLTYQMAQDRRAKLLREAEDYSGLSADVELPEAPAGGQIVLACAPDEVERLGTKGLQQIGVVR